MRPQLRLGVDPNCKTSYCISMSFRIMCIGEILFDIYPDQQHLGGAPLNFACHLHHFGHSVALVSSVGHDGLGKQIKVAVSQIGLPTDYLQMSKTRPSGSVSVTIDKNGEPQYAIAEEVAYDAIRAHQSASHFLNNGIDLIYFGTLAQRGLISRQTIRRYLASVPSSTLIFCDVNLREPFYTPKILRESLALSQIVKVNESEFMQLRQIFQLDEQETIAVRQLMEKFGIDHICITRGAIGSSLYSGAKHCEFQISEVADVKNTVGAGDAFAAMLAHGLLNNWQPKAILAAASEFAAAICRISGAIPPDKQFYRQHAATALWT